MLSYNSKNTSSKNLVYYHEFDASYDAILARISENVLHTNEASNSNNNDNSNFPLQISSIPDSYANTPTGVPIADDFESQFDINRILPTPLLPKSFNIRYIVQTKTGNGKKWENSNNAPQKIHKTRKISLLDLPNYKKTLRITIKAKSSETDTIARISVSDTTDLGVQRMINKSFDKTLKDIENEEKNAVNNIDKSTKEDYDKMVRKVKKKFREKRQLAFANYCCNESIRISTKDNSCVFFLHTFRKKEKKPRHDPIYSLSVKMMINNKSYKVNLFEFQAIKNHKFESSQNGKKQNTMNNEYNTVPIINY